MAALGDAFIGTRSLLKRIFDDSIVVSTNKGREGYSFFEESTDAAIFIAKGKEGFAHLVAIGVKSFFDQAKRFDFQILVFDFAHGLLLAAFAGSGVHDLPLENKEENDLGDGGEDEDHQEVLRLEGSRIAEVIDANHQWL